MNRFWEPKVKAWNVQVLPGELYVTRDDEMITTVLGSCVAACIRDPDKGVGGMNHFMLPRAPANDAGAPARYGVYALELLINDILRRGGKRPNLEVKVFGGGRVIECGGDIGLANIAFVRKFFADEKLAIVSEDVGEHYARRIRYWPKSGRAQVAQMPMAQAAKAERKLTQKIAPIRGGDVELF